MISLSTVQERILQVQQAAEQQKGENARELLFDLMYDLLQDDSGFYVLKTGSEYFLAPPRPDDPRLFLRVFSAETLAKDYHKGDKKFEQEPLSSLDLLRLCKWAFLHGAYGVILNEGDTWTAISIPDLLRTFFERALPEEACCEQSYVDAIRLLAAVRQNAAYQLCWDGNGDGEGSRRIRPHPEHTARGSHSEPPVTLRSLLHIKGPLDVALPNAEFTVDPESLSAALADCGVTEDSVSNPPVSGFYNEPADWSPSETGYQSVIDIRLLPRVGLPGEARATGESPDAASRTEQVHGAPGSFSLKQRIRESAARIWASLKSGANGKPGKGASRIRSARQSLSSLHNRALNTKRPGLAVAAVVSVALVASIVIGVTAAEVRQRRALSRFRELLESYQYENALAAYRENNLGQQAERVLSEQIEALISDYARNRISAAELGEGLQAIARYPGTEEALDAAFIMAAGLESSKSAYVSGKTSEDIPDRLALWARVSPADEANYDKVRQTVAGHAEEWNAELLERVSEIAYIDRGAAKRYIAAAELFYGENEETRRWGNIFEKEDARAPLRSYPIRILSLHFSHDTREDALSVYIRWQNNSSRSIDSICCYFAFLDDAGNRISYTRRGQQIAIFRGVDSANAPYAPGYAVTSRRWGWQEVWRGKGSLVSSASLLSVEVNYSDGTRDVFATEGDLRSIVSEYATDWLG